MADIEEKKPWHHLVTGDVIERVGGRSRPAGYGPNDRPHSQPMPAPRTDQTAIDVLQYYQDRK